MTEKQFSSFDLSQDKAFNVDPVDEKREAYIREQNFGIITAFMARLAINRGLSLQEVFDICIDEAARVPQDMELQRKGFEKAREVMAPHL